MLGAQAASPSAPPRQRAFVVFRRPNAAHRACGSRVNPAGHPLGNIRSGRGTVPLDQDSGASRESDDQLSPKKAISSSACALVTPV
jgi:hypothetical protein